MQRLHVIAAAIVLLLMISASACSSAPTNTAVPTQKAAPASTSAPPTAALPTNTAVPTQKAAPTAAPTTPPVTLAPTAAPTTAAATTPPAGETYAPVIDPANFVSTVDNPYFPLKPGTIYIYEGKTEKGNEHVEVTVGSKPKVILGVTCVAVTDIVTVDGQLEEGTVDWYAQDQQGNVWYFGEDTKEYKDGKVTGTHGAWEAGVNGAKPGIIMKANSVVGDTYRQEYYKGEAEDMATVLSLSDSASVPTGSYSHLLVTNEWSALANPPVFEHKYYAKGIGNILVTYVGSDQKLKLIEIRHQ